MTLNGKESRYVKTRTDRMESKRCDAASTERAGSGDYRTCIG